jgi:hypothetical protein
MLFLAQVSAARMDAREAQQRTEMCGRHPKIHLARIGLICTGSPHCRKTYAPHLSERAVYCVEM